MAWKFTYDGHVYSEGDVTVDQWIDICDLADSQWAFVNPMRSPKDAKSIFTVLVADNTGEERDATSKIIGDMSTDEFLSLFEQAKDDLPSEYEDGIPT